MTSKAITSKLKAGTGSERATVPLRSVEEREKTRALKRQALLTAAVRMFNERGFHATSLDDVAASLGLTKPVIYHYLGSKEQVLFECLRQGLAQLQDAAARARRERGSGLDRLKAFLRQYAMINMEDFGRCVIRTGEETLSAETRVEFRKLKREIDKAMRQMIEEAVADGSAQVDDVRLAAFALAGALNWPALWYREDGAESAEAIAAKLVDALCAGLIPNAVSR